jgi:hypothetical protein
MGLPSWDTPRPRAPGGVPGQRTADSGQTRPSVRTPGRARTARRPPRRGGGGDAAGGGRGAQGGEGVLARLGEVSGVVTETRQYGGDRPRPLSQEPPNTR